MTKFQSALVVLSISALCLFGDYLLKRASQSPAPFRTPAFACGTLIFALSASGWVVALRMLKLGAVGVIYGVSTVLFMAVLGWLAFGESLRWHECVGMILGIASILLLTRFS